MNSSHFSDEERKLMNQHVQNYLREEFSLEIGQFEAGFFLEFLDKRLGAHYYNQGLRDAQVALSNHNDGLMESLYGLEKSISAEVTNK